MKYRLPNLPLNSEQARVVSLIGPLERNAAQKLIAEVKSLARLSSRPIVIHINSSGGRVEAFHELELALFPGRVEGAKHPCIVTMARKASSAAAYFFVMGHQAWVHRHASIHLHGVRTRSHLKIKVLALDNTLAMAMRFESENRKIALNMASRTVFRLAARFCDMELSRSTDRHNPEAAVLIDDFAMMIEGHLSSRKNQELLHESLDRFRLIFSQIRRLPLKLTARHQARLVSTDIRLFQAIIAEGMEAEHRQGKGIDASLAAELMVDFLLASSLVQDSCAQQVRELAESMGLQLVRTREIRRYHELKKISPRRAKDYLADKAWPMALGLWCFALTLCHQLLLGNYTLNAQDAYWLGLADKVVDRDWRSGKSIKF